ncbi:hypothetical protein [Streptomyces fragilis]|uniref:Uncharacterized protein n=1 Tax=Streptomyces fragilis TaxID=67301 RepID=A0ABV2YQP3_9ACTN|nr:hypothetical protein [Streptomyces fragilis]
MLPPHLVRLGFDYVLAVAAGDDGTAARFTPEVGQLPGLLPVIADLVVFPVTALSGDTDPCTDSFVLDEVGVLYLAAIRAWAAHAPRPPDRESPAPSRTSWPSSSPMHRPTPSGLCRGCATSRSRGPARWWGMWWLCTADRTTAPPHHRTTAPDGGAPVR